MLGSFVLSPMSAKGLKPAMSPKPIGPFSCVSGSCGFCPACIVGSCWGAAGCADGPERAAPLTMWIVCDDWILYVDSTSSSFSTRPAPHRGQRSVVSQQNQVFTEPPRRTGMGTGRGKGEGGRRRGAHQSR